MKYLAAAIAFLIYNWYFDWVDWLPRYAAVALIMLLLTGLSIAYQLYKEEEYRDKKPEKRQEH